MAIPFRQMPPPAMAELDILEKPSDHSCNITTANALILEANNHRTAAWFVNDSDTTIYLKLGAAAALNTGIRLNAAGGSFEILKGNMFKGEVYAIHGAIGDKVLCIQELESRYAY